MDFLSKMKKNRDLKNSIKAKDLKSVVRLLEEGADPNHQPLFGDHVLATAIDTKDEKIVQALLKAGADENAFFGCTDENITPIRKALNNDLPNIVETLLKKPETDIFQTNSRAVLAGHFHHASAFYFDLPPAVKIAKNHNNPAMYALCMKYRGNDITKHTTKKL